MQSSTSVQKHIIETASLGVTEHHTPNRVIEANVSQNQGCTHLCVLRKEVKNDRVWSLCL